MDIQEILTPERTVIAYQNETSKKQLFELISHLIHDSCPDIKYKAILSAIQQREKLGSTHMGHGVAIPHGRVTGLSGAIATLVILDKPLQYDTDKEPITIVLGLLAPEDANEQHIEALSTFADKLCISAYRDSLRQASDNRSLYSAAIAPIKTQQSEPVEP
jgi:nitrogen PTS system EIIA component